MPPLECNYMVRSNHRLDGVVANSEFLSDFKSTTTTNRISVITNLFNNKLTNYEKSLKSFRKSL